MAQLAIKGHKTRGSEVIEILEMFGGINTQNLYGDENYAYYTIDSDKEIKAGIYVFDDKNVIIFTLEEFLEKFPYKIGDKVQHKGATSCGTVYVIEKMRWVGDNVEYTVKHLYYNNCHSVVTTEDLQPYKEENVDKVIFGANAQCCDIMNHLIKKEIMEERKYANLRLDVDQDDKLATEATIDGDKITPPKNYLIGKITKVDNGMLVEFVKKQSEYPKTFIEVLNFWHPDRQIEDDYQRCYKKYIIEKLQDLLYARDAYWKIAGEQMGLGKPWEFKLGSDSKEVVYAISVFGTGIMLDFYYALNCNKILVFPTEEMRDVFYKNFKDLIEQCKELL